MTGEGIRMPWGYTGGEGGEGEAVVGGGMWDFVRGGRRDLYRGVGDEVRLWGGGRGMGTVRWAAKGTGVSCGC